MTESKIDESKVIRIEPQYRVWGVLVENEKHSERLILSGRIAVICGMIGGLGLIATLSCFYCL